LVPDWDNSKLIAVDPNYFPDERKLLAVGKLHSREELQTDPVVGAEKIQRVQKQ